MRKLHQAASCLAVLLICTAVHSDDWASPQVREVFSKSRDYFVRVIPGNSWGDAVGFKGADKGSYAKAQFFRRQADQSYKLTREIQTGSPVAPVDFFVSGAGYLVTLDNWHNVGYGKIAVFYSPEGTLIRAYTLDDLFSKEEIEQFDHSVSSIWWRSYPGNIQPDQKTLPLDVEKLGAGSSLIVEMQTGGYQFCHWEDKANTIYRCRASNKNREWKPFHEP